MQNVGKITARLQELDGLAKNGERNKSASVEELNRAAFSSKGNLNENHFNRLWQRMSETFGHRWVSSYGEEPNQSWIDGLADMTVDDIKNGLARLKNWDGEGWPPTLLQFRELCKPRTTPAHDIYKPLPAPTSPLETRKSIASACIASLRETCLKSDEGRRGSSLTDDDKALLRLINGEGGDEERALAARLRQENTVCTCQMMRDGGRYVVSEVKCSTCQALKKMEVHHQLAPAPIIHEIVYDD